MVASPGLDNKISELATTITKKHLAVGHSQGLIQIYLLGRTKVAPRNGSVDMKRSKESMDDSTLSVGGHQCCFLFYEYEREELETLNERSDFLHSLFKNHSRTQLKVDITQAPGDSAEVAFKDLYVKSKRITKGEPAPRRKSKSASAKKQRQIHYLGTLKEHHAPIVKLRFCNSLGMLLSFDEEGIVCIWQFEKQRLINRFFLHNYCENSLYKRVFMEDTRDNFISRSHINSSLGELKNLAPKEKVKDVSVMEETGDFAVVSSGYLMVYNVRGVLLALENREEDKQNKEIEKFTACLLTSVIINFNKLTFHCLIYFQRMYISFINLNCR